MTTPDLRVDDRPRCLATKQLDERGKVPCDRERGHSGMHEWMGDYTGQGGKRWK